MQAPLLLYTLAYILQSLLTSMIGQRSAVPIPVLEIWEVRHSGWGGYCGVVFNAFWHQRMLPLALARLVAGSSPRVWGTPRFARLHSPQVRFIPQQQGFNEAGAVSPGNPCAWRGLPYASLQLCLREPTNPGHRLRP